MPQPLGLSVGENATYLLGRLVGFKLLKLFPFNYFFKKRHIYRASRFLKHRGPSMMFLVRFLPGTRTITFFTAGLFKLKYTKFFPMWVLGLYFLCGTLISIGYFSIRSVIEAKEFLPLILLGMFIFGVILFFISRKITRKKN
ncbi:MAG: VTT domain-containing protein [Halobacteriovoraceae bacterium]|nr:VTT domain-containing protein [Halobacteriovoraceae bacterium]